MGDIVGGLFGGDQADAAKGAAGAQVQATKIATASQEKMLERNIEFAKESREVARGDLQPFREAGASNITGLVDLITNPQKQLEFVENNPFFGAMANKAKDEILGNMAAKGKVGSGGTAEALQNSLLLLGNDLLNQNIGHRNNLVTMGANAAAGQATTTQQTAANVGNAISNTSNTISDLITQGGNAQAAGIMGAANAKTSAMNNILNAGITAFALCDVRAKENVERVGQLHNGLPLYSFNYEGEDQIRINVMAQDVEDVIPDAVIEQHGMKYVDMEKVITWQ